MKKTYVEASSGEIGSLYLSRDGTTLQLVSRDMKKATVLNTFTGRHVEIPLTYKLTISPGEDVSPKEEKNEEKEEVKEKKAKEPEKKPEKKVKTAETKKKATKLKGISADIVEFVKSAKSATRSEIYDFLVKPIPESKKQLFNSHLGISLMKLSRNGDIKSNERKGVIYFMVPGE